MMHLIMSEFVGGHEESLEQRLLFHYFCFSFFKIQFVGSHFSGKKGYG